MAHRGKLCHVACHHNRSSAHLLANRPNALLPAQRRAVQLYTGAVPGFFVRFACAQNRVQRATPTGPLCCKALPRLITSCPLRALLHALQTAAVWPTGGPSCQSALVTSSAGTPLPEEHRTARHADRTLAVLQRLDAAASHRPLCLRCATAHARVAQQHDHRIPPPDAPPEPGIGPSLLRPTRGMSTKRVAVPACIT